MKTENVRSLKSIIFQVFILLFALIINFPLIYAFFVSFTPANEILSSSANFIPKTFTLENYKLALSHAPMGRFMWNSLVVAVGTSIARTFTAACAAFGFSFFKFKGRDVLFTIVIGTIMIPAEIVLVTNYQTVSSMGLINTYLGIMIVMLVSANNIFLVRQSFLSYSQSIREAALIDGCGNFKFFVNILVPSSKPVLITVFIQAFISAWNAYLWPMMVTTVESMRTVQTAITMLNFPDGSVHGQIMAATVIVLIPSILLFLVFQRSIISGMMTGAVKE